ncbi:MAG: lysophospholipid acyltransferase family protein, partial [Planctomycetota bacterium]
LVQDLCTVADVAARLARRGSGAKAPRVATPVVVKAEPKPLTVPPALKSMGNKVLSFLQRKAYEGPMRTKVTGREHIPWHTPTIVVANHCSHLDVGLIKHALGEYGRHAGSLAASDYFFKTPIRKMYFENFTEVLPMDRDAVSRDKLETVVTHVLEGQTVIMFPEGTRSTSGEVAPFLPGLGYLVSKAKIGVLPIFLEGTHDALAKGARVPRSRDIAAHIGPYLPHEELQRAAAGLSRHQAYRAISRAVRREVIALAPEGTVATPDPIEQLGDGLLTKVTVALTPVEPVAAPLTAAGRLGQLVLDLPNRVEPGAVTAAKTFYIKAGDGADERWTITLVPGKGLRAEVGKTCARADCVVRAEPKILTNLITKGDLPSFQDVAFGRFKTNDPDGLRALTDALGLSMAPK